MRAAANHQVPMQLPRHPASWSGHRTASGPLVRPPRRLHLGGLAAELPPPRSPVAAPPGPISTSPAAITRRRASRSISLTPPVRDFETRDSRNPRLPVLLGRSWEAEVKFLGSPTSLVRPVHRPLRRRDMQHSGVNTIITFSVCTRSSSPRSRAVRATNHISSLFCIAAAIRQFVSRSSSTSVAFQGWLPPQPLLHEYVLSMQFLVQTM